MTETMSCKERWLAAIHLGEVDRLPFWPKIGGGYTQRRTARLARDRMEPLHAWIGSDPHEWLPATIREQRRHSSVEVRQDGHHSETIYRLNDRETRGVSQFDPASQSWHPMVFPVTNLEQIQLMTEIFNDVEIAVDQAARQAAETRYRQADDTVFFGTGIGESPLMEWVEHLAGIAKGHLLLNDHTAAVEELFAAMHRVLLARTQLLAETTPADVLYLIENTSTTLISPRQYSRYCYHHIHAYGSITRACGKPLVLHMCGHLKALLDELGRLPVEAFEAFTSPTVGNTTLADGRTHCPDKCLIGGTNAALWLRSGEEIIRQLETDLDALPHHRGIVVTSAGVMPPACEPETIKQVCDWVKQYPLAS